MNEWLVWFAWTALFALATSTLTLRLIATRGLPSLRQQRRGTGVSALVALTGTGAGVYHLLTTPVVFSALSPSSPAFASSTLPVVIAVLGAVAWFVYAFRQRSGWQWLMRGDALIREQRYREAQAAYERLLAKPHIKRFGQTRGWYGIAVAQVGQSRFQEALEACDRACSAAEGTLSETLAARVWQVKAMALGALRREQEALVACDQALSLDPHSAMAWASKAGTLRRVHRYEEALVACERALEEADRARADTWRGAILIQQAMILNASGRYDEALAVAEQAVDLIPYPIGSWLAQADALTHLGYPVEGQEAARRGMAILEKLVIERPDAQQSMEMQDLKAALLQHLSRNTEE